MVTPASGVPHVSASCLFTLSAPQVTPYDEPNDIVYPMSYDQPDGCQRFYDYNASCHKFWADTSHRPGPLSDPEPGVLGMGCSPPAA